MMLETSHGVLGRGRESNCKHDQQNNILHEQILFKCKLPKVIFFFSGIFSSMVWKDRSIFFLMFKYVIQTAVESYRHPPSLYLLSLNFFPLNSLEPFPAAMLPGSDS